MLLVLLVSQQQQQQQQHNNVRYPGDLLGPAELEMGAPSTDLVSGPELSSHVMKSSLVLILLSPLLTTAQDTQEEELVITVGDLVQMYNEEEDGAAPVSRETKQIVSKDSVDFEAVVGELGDEVCSVLVTSNMAIWCRRWGGEEMCGEDCVGAGDRLDTGS